MQLLPQTIIHTSAGSRISGIPIQTTSHPAHEEEADLQDSFENNNYHKALDPEDFAVDRGWWYRCRRCDSHTRVHSKQPSCNQCGFTPKN